MTANIRSNPQRMNWIFVGVLLMVMLCGISFLPPVLYLAGAFFAFLIGNAQLKTDGGAPSYGATAQPQVQSAATTRVELPERNMPEKIPADLKCPSCGANIKVNARQCTYCGSVLIPLADLPEPAKLAALEVGKKVRVATPQGERDYTIRGRLLFTELWQASTGPNVPWTPTGNYYAGFALDGGVYLLNWQNRFYLLNERRALTDMEINRDFAPYARQFAQSNQTAHVEFPYASGRWKMVDIGRFAIEFEDGEGSHLHKGAIGRFIHMSSGNQALVLDDFQSGGSGGQDTLWKGFQIKETDVKF